MRDKEIKVLFQQKSIESAARYFLQSLKGSYFYLKWIESEYALKLVQSSPPCKTKIIRLYESNPQFKLEQLNKPQQITNLNRWIQNLSGNKTMHGRLISVKEKPFAVLFSENKEDSLIDCFENHCELLLWKNQCKSFSSYDYFLKILYSEISRARRLRHPVGLILIKCLSSAQLKSESDKNLFFKSLLNHLRKNNRMYDTLSQISSDEIACILPHTSEKGALKKAQKIHWMLKTLARKNVLNKEITFQVTVAEYPTVGRDAVSLLHIARESCASGDGQNVCAAKIPAAFRPDFSVQPVDETSLSELI